MHAELSWSYYVSDLIKKIVHIKQNPFDQVGQHDQMDLIKILNCQELAKFNYVICTCKTTWLAS